MFHTYVASALSGCYVCLQWFSIVFASVSPGCFKCFICLFFYVASIAFECFKSVSDAAYVMRMGSRRVRERSPVLAPFRRRG
jgi:hypothetical protein